MFAAGPEAPEARRGAKPEPAGMLLTVGVGEVQIEVSAPPGEVRDRVRILFEHEHAGEGRGRELRVLDDVVTEGDCSDQNGQMGPPVDVVGERCDDLGAAALVAVDRPAAARLAGGQQARGA